MLARVELFHGNLSTSRHRLAPHPDCARCSAHTDELHDPAVAALASLANLESSGPPQSRLSSALQRAIDARDPTYGLVRAFDDDDLEHLPLCRARVVLASGRRLLASAEEHVVARRRATRMAIVDVAVSSELSVAGRGRRSSRVEFPTLSLSAPTGAPAAPSPPRDWGLDTTYLGLVYDCLLRAIRRDLCEMASRNTLVGCTIDSEVAGARASWLARSLVRLRGKVSLSRLSHWSRVPAVAATAGGNTSIAVKPTLVAAIENALVELVQHAQALRHGESMDSTGELFDLSQALKPSSGLEPPLELPSLPVLMGRMRAHAQIGVLRVTAPLHIGGHEFVAGHMHLSAINRTKGASHG